LLSVIVFSLVLIGLISASSFGQQVESIKLTLDKTSYVYGDIILISGEVEEILDSVILEIYSPGGAKFFSSYVVVSDSKFSTEITTLGPLWESSGKYTVTVFSPSKSSTGATTIELTSVIDEPTIEFTTVIDEPTPKPKDPDKSETVESKATKLSIPDWVRNIFIWYAEDRISEDELLEAIQFLIDQGILQTR